jgi:CDP-diacylglycerol--serine O-phosphatidyltransferase
MKKIDFRFALPNLITLLGLCLGLNSLKLAFQGNFEKSIIFLTLAAIIDAADGRIARILKGTSKFGAELDSLTDFVNFGVCPSLIIYFWTSSSSPIIGWTISLFYIVACCLRLARFNVSIDKTYEEKWRENFFTGVPAPAAAGLVLMPMIISFSEFRLDFDQNFLSKVIMILVSFLMISKIPTYALKKIKMSKNIFVLVALIFVIFFTLLFYKTFETLVFAGVFYFLTIPVSFIHFLNLKRKSKIKSSKTDSLISDEII